MHRSLAKRAAIALAAILALSLSACNSSSDSGDDTGPIKLGLTTALSGPNSIFGTTAKNAIGLAIAELNASGGLLGRRVELVMYDDQLDPQKAQVNTRRLINDDKVAMLFGPAGSGAVLATVGLATASNLLFFNWIGQSDAITYPNGLDNPPNPNVFSTSLPNSIEATFLAQNIAKVGTKVGLIAETTPYGQTSLDIIESKIQGATVVAREGYEQNATNMTAQLLKINNAGADVILPIALGPDLVTMRNNMETLGMTQPLAGGGGLGLAGYHSVVGQLANGSLFATPRIYATDGEYTAEAQKYADDYKAAYGNDEAYGKGENPQPSFGVFATRAYQAAQIYFLAVEAAGSLDTAKVREVLESGKEFATVDGAVSYSKENHNAFEPDDIVFGKVVVAADGSVTFEPAFRD